MSVAALRGHCACEAVRVTITPPTERLPEDEDAPIVEVGGHWTAIADHCHCRLCTLVGGAVMATDVIVPRRTISWEGEEHIVVYKSSEHVARRFVRLSTETRLTAQCGQCGSKLHYDHDEKHYANVPLALFLGDERHNDMVSHHLRAEYGLASPEDKRDLVVWADGRAGGLAAYVGYSPPVRFASPPPGEGSTMTFACLCGDVRIEAPRSSESAHCCCLECCRSTGGLLWSVVRVEAVPLPSTLVVHGRRGFCGRCGTVMSFVGDDGRLSLSLVALTDYTLFQPGPSETIHVGDQRGLRLGGADRAESIFGVLEDEGQPRFVGRSGPGAERW